MLASLLTNFAIFETKDRFFTFSRAVVDVGPSSNESSQIEWAHGCPNPSYAPAAAGVRSVVFVSPAVLQSPHRSLTWLSAAAPSRPA